MSVFEFQNFRDFLKARIDQQIRGPGGRRRSNLTRVSKKLGYNSPSLLSMVLNGSRLPSDALVDTLLSPDSPLGVLSVRERDYVRLLADLERAKSRGQDPSPVLKALQKKLERVRGDKPVHSFGLRDSEVVRNWHVFVIKELLGAPGFVEKQDDLAWVSKRLRKKVTPTEIKRAYDLLVEAGAARRNPETGKVEPVVGYSETTHDIASGALVSLHKSMAERAAEAVQEQSVDERHFNSLTLRVDPARLREAKDRILAFAREFNEHFGSEESDRVYQLNLHFFQHTTDEKREPKGTALAGPGAAGVAGASESPLNEEEGNHVGTH